MYTSVLELENDRALLFAGVDVLIGVFRSAPRCIMVAQWSVGDL